MSDAVGGFSHLDSEGRARMVDVGDKDATRRRAVARARVTMSAETARALVSGTVAKGDVLAVARVAGIQGAKRTSELIPLCHPLMLSSVSVDLTVGDAWVDIEAVAEVLRGDWLTTGPKVEAFEKALAAKLGAAHAVSCSSGTAGLHLAMMAMGLGPGDSVIVPTMTFVSTATMVSQVGAEVVFADVDPDTGLMGAAQFAEALERAGAAPVKAVIPVHLAGQCADLAEIAKLAEARGQSIPDDWVVDKNGRQTTDPAALSDGGAIQPLGGAQGFKGYGLAAMVEIFSGLLTGLGFGVEPTGKHNDGVFMAVFNVAAFRPLDQFKQEVTEFAEYLKATPTAEGYDEVLYPGEIEHQRMQKRLVEGIEVEDATWNKLVALAEKYDVGEIVA